MAPREELLLILDLTSTVLRAGVGVTDLIRGPLLELPTRVALVGSASRTKPPTVEDYLVGHHLTEAERLGQTSNHEIVYPLAVDPRLGFTVTDWVGLEAILRYALHTSLQLARPPLAHPTVLSVPPSLSHSTVDGLHRLLFERLLVPSLLLSSRPFFAAGATGITSGIVLDVGWRGEGCEVSVVHENQLYEPASGTRLGWVDEGVLDDYLAVQVWQENRSTLIDAFKLAKETESDLPKEVLLDGTRRIVAHLKEKDLIGFESKHYAAGKISGEDASLLDGGEEGTFDVAKVVAEGKVADIVNKKKHKSKKGDAGGAGGDFVTVPNPFCPPPPPPPIDLTVPVPEIPEHHNVSIGPSRHLYLEPLLFPQVLTSTLTSTNEAAREIGLTYFEGISVPASGIQEVLGTVLSEIEPKETRDQVAENLVVISSGRVASNRALGSTLIPLLTPFVQNVTNDPALDEQDPSAGASGRQPIKFARTPDYFSNFKPHTGDWAVYLGACIMGKLLIGDQQSKLFMTKADYASKGPAYYRQLELIAS
ncbi:uncharacterized protein JCM15063_001368 [Sporobolomyces koalae]|uniref:uncharacterized protein n=1 Tax=Sporobolomyces koalae TaxID=500713 RepID=UPI00317D5990